MKIFIISLILTFYSFCSLGQEIEWNDAFLSQMNVEEMVNWTQSENDPDLWFVTTRNNKKEGFYAAEICRTNSEDEESDSLYICNLNVLLPPEYKKISAFVAVDSEKLDPNYVPSGEVEIATLTKGKKTGIAFRWNDYDLDYYLPKHFHDKIDWSYSPETQVAVRNNKLWGVYDWFHLEMVVECAYSTIKDLPKNEIPDGLDGYAKEIFIAFNKQASFGKIDKIELDPDNGDGLFKARHKELQKWGLFQFFWDESVEAIPMQYDSLYHFDWNGKFTAVFNDGKVGFYLSYWSYNEEAKQTVACIYDGYKKFVDDNNVLRLAVLKNNKWGWVDWLTGEEKSTFDYDSVEDLPNPTYDQKIWFDE